MKFQLNDIFFTQASDTKSSSIGRQKPDTPTLSNEEEKES